MAMGSEFRRKLLWLIGVRPAVLTVVLGAALLVPFGPSGQVPTDALLALLVLAHVLTLGYLAALKLFERHRWLVGAQLGVDVLVVTAIIWITGGVSSYFSSLYFLPIIAASILQSRRGGLGVAGLSALGCVGIVVGQYTSGALGGSALLLPPARVAAFMLGLNTLGFVSVAVLSGYLAEGLRRAGDRLEQASTEIADLQAFNQHVIESLSSGLVTADDRGRILTFNPGAESIIGVQAATVSGRGVDEVLQLPLGFDRSLDRVRQGGGSARVDYIFTRDDGQRIEIGLSTTALVTTLGPAGFLYTFQDVTDVKRLERESRIQQRLAAVGEMAAGIAHEIRNPLASMSGSIQILRRELSLSSEQAQLMDIVLRESTRLNDAIRSLLTYARPQRFATSRFDLSALVKDTALLLRNSAELGERHVIDVDTPPGGVWYEADEGQIRQVIWNLATNGLRAMPQGGRLQLAAAREADGVSLTVSDEGVGMSADRLSELVQPFRGTFPKGSGLGLAIVHRIVSDYGGEIELASPQNVGTRVRVLLPIGVMAKSA